MPTLSTPRYGRPLVPLLWFAACSAADPCPEGALDPVLTLGEGHSSFQVLTDTAPFPEYGPQGGQHLVLAARVETDDQAAEPLAMSFRADVVGPACPEGCSVGDVTYRLGSDVARESDDGALVFAGLLLVVSQWPLDVPRALSGRVEDTCGRAAEDSWFFASTLEEL